MENALTATLAMIVENMPLADAQRERITKLMSLPLIVLDEGP